MADKTWTGALTTVWETAGNWTGGKPGVNDRAIITDANDTKPDAPVGAETIHDLQVSSASASVVVDLRPNLTVSNTIVLDAVQVKILAQSAAGAITLTNAAKLTATNNLAGALIADATSYATATNFNGNVTAGTQNHISGKINADLSIPSGQDATRQLTWGASSTVHFTGAGVGVLSVSDSDPTGPLTIVAAGSLVILAGNGGDPFDLAGSSITVGGSCVVLKDVTDTSALVDLDGATVTGPSTAGSFFADFGATGTYTVAGFEPLYKLGAAGSTLDSFGSGAVITLPLKADVKSGVTYGPPDNEQLGELSAGGGGGGGKLGLGL